MSYPVPIILWINRGAGWVLLWHLLHRAPNEEQESCSRLDFFLEISACHNNHSRISHFPVNLCFPFSLLVFLIIVGILYCMRDQNEGLGEESTQFSRSEAQKREVSSGLLMRRWLSSATCSQPRRDKLPGHPTDDLGRGCLRVRAPWQG